MDNFPHYLRAADAMKAGWSSSARYAIEELLLSRGTKNTSQWDDDQAIAVEAMEIARHQGEIGHTKNHRANLGREGTRSAAGTRLSGLLRSIKM
jgi:hypothetical protein